MQKSNPTDYSRRIPWVRMDNFFAIIKGPLSQRPPEALLTARMNFNARQTPSGAVPLAKRAKALWRHNRLTRPFLACHAGSPGHCKTVLPPWGKVKCPLMALSLPWRGFNAAPLPSGPVRQLRGPRGPPIRIEVSGPPDGTGAPPTTPPGPSTPLAPSAPAPDRLSAADFFVALNDRLGCGGSLLLGMWQERGRACWTSVAHHHHKKKLTKSTKLSKFSQVTKNHK